MTINKICTVVKYLVRGVGSTYTESEKTFVGRIPASKVEKPAGVIVAAVEYVKKRVTVDDAIINESATFEDVPADQSEDKTAE